MKKILIISIDQPFRAIYAALIAHAIKENTHWVKISAILRQEADIFKETDTFDQILNLDVNGFTAKAKNLSRDFYDKELKSKIVPILNTNWDLIINISEHPIALTITSFLKTQEFKGAYIDKNKEMIVYSNFCSYLLSNPNNYGSLPLNIKNIYFEILEKKEINPIIKNTKFKEQISDFKTHIETIKNKNKKEKVVIIDSTILDDDHLASIGFLDNVYKAFHYDLKWQPILIAPESEDHSYIISKLRDLVDGQIYLMSTNDIAMLTIFESAELIITNKMKLKAFSDIVNKPSIFISNEQFSNYSDISTVEGSVFIQFSNEDNVLNLLEKVVSDFGNLTKDKFTEFKSIVLQTISHEEYNKIKILNLNQSFDPVLDFLRWHLYSNFILFGLSKKIDNQDVRNELYFKIINKEKDIIKKDFNNLIEILKKEGIDTNINPEKIQDLESSYSLMSLGVMKAHLNLGNNIYVAQHFLKDMKNQIKLIMDYLAVVECK